MTEKSGWESFKGEGAALLGKITGMIREGNVRRVVVELDGRTIAEFPLTAGVVGVVLAPVVAAIAAVVVLYKDCTVHIERAPASEPEAAAKPADSPRGV